MTRTAINPSDVVINNFKLIHKEGEIKLLPLTTQLDIYETIKRPCIRALVNLSDTNGILSKIQLSGSIVELEFYSIDEEQETKFKFIVDKVSNVQNESRVTTYTLEMITPEYYTAISTQVTANFTEMEPEKMIAVILKEYMKVNDKKFSFEDTGSLDTVPITNMNALRAIDKIRRRSVSLTNKSSSFLFYENKNGFNFYTIEELYNIGKGDDKIGDRKFTTKPFQLDSREVSWRNILGYEQVRVQNLAETISLGGIKNIIWTFNLETGAYTRSVFEKTEDTSTRNESSISTNISAKYSPSDDTEQAKNVFVVIRNENDLQRGEKQSKLAGFLPKILSNIINIHVHGDNLLTAGEVCQMTITAVNEFTTLDEDKMLTGKYIISSVRHIITNNNGVRKYTCACELIKPGFAETIA